MYGGEDYYAMYRIMYVRWRGLLCYVQDNVCKVERIFRRTYYRGDTANFEGDMTVMQNYMELRE